MWSFNDPMQTSPALSSEQIYERLRAIAIERLSLTPEQIESMRPDLPLVEGLQLDSLAQVTLIAAIEDEFGIVLEIEDRQRVTTIRDLVTLIRERSAAT
jgi:acyl carrier protein